MEIVRTGGGRIRGVTAGGVVAFRGIPYAAAPEGALRFAAPAPPAPWAGVRDATEFGPAPPQAAPAPGVPAAWRPADGLDCLTLNVWTPDLGVARLPVMVWLYGGGWKIGSTRNPVFDGAALAGEGVVVVTVNYRIGFEGFGVLPGTPANRGLLDQLAALEWVQREIAAFGGDPGNVTVFGQSAGAASIGLHLGNPAAGGLFRRAIAQSIPEGLRTPDEAGRMTQSLAATARVSPTRDGFATLPPEAVVAIQDTPLHDQNAGFSAFGPVLDGRTVTGPTWVTAAHGRDVDLLCGYTHHEHRYFTMGADLSGLDLDRVAATMGRPPGTAAAYRAAYPAADDAGRFIELASDALVRMPTTWTAEAHTAAGGRTWMYDFAWPSPRFGACHTLDVPFVFGTPAAPSAARLLGAPPPESFGPLSTAIRKAWTAFAATGDPGWPRYDGTHRLTRIWTTPPTTARDPLQATRPLWPRPTR